MAKTVFGVPGVGKKPEGGGGAVAPGGTPGAKSTGGLPQKPGKAPAQGGAKAAPVAKPAPAAAKPKAPQMAKPMAVPVAKPVAATRPAVKVLMGKWVLAHPNTDGFTFFLNHRFNGLLIKVSGVFNSLPNDTTE